MSRYVILRLNNETNPYAGKDGQPFYELFTHWNSKFGEDHPYFSANLSKNAVFAQSVTKKELPAFLKQAQNFICPFNKTKYSKKGKIFVLKMNSPKLNFIRQIS